MDDSMSCIECGARPPETESAYTLIGGKAGWRLTRVRAADGSVTTQWRCAECWHKFKKASAPAAPGVAASPAPRGAALSSAPEALKRR